jgi:hypothetical protein
MQYLSKRQINIRLTVQDSNDFQYSYYFLLFSIYVVPRFYFQRTTLFMALFISSTWLADVVEISLKFIIIKSLTYDRFPISKGFCIINTCNQINESTI